MGRVIAQMQGNRATFSFSLDDRKWERLGAEFELRMGDWRGDRIGFFCWNDETDEIESSVLFGRLGLLAAGGLRSPQ